MEEIGKKVQNPITNQLAEQIKQNTESMIATVAEALIKNATQKSENNM